MELWVYILLTVDMALMGGILYILLSRRGSKKAPEGATAAVKADEGQLERIRADVEKRYSFIGSYERSFEEKNRMLEAVIKAAEESARNLEALYESRNKDEVYAKAMSILKTGASAEEVTKDLGLLSGEAELIAAISNYRV